LINYAHLADNGEDTDKFATSHLACTEDVEKKINAQLVSNLKMAEGTYNTSEASRQTTVLDEQDKLLDDHLIKAGNWKP